MRDFGEHMLKSKFLFAAISIFLTSLFIPANVSSAAMPSSAVATHPLSFANTSSTGATLPRPSKPMLESPRPTLPTTTTIKPIQAGGSALTATPSPKEACELVRDVKLPNDSVMLAAVQMNIVRCALHVYNQQGRNQGIQCVPFAFALIKILNPSISNNRLPVKNGRNFFTADEGLGVLRKNKKLLPTQASTGMPVSSTTRPILVWWSSEGITGGHVGVYIGNGLFLDNKAATWIAEYEGRLSTAVKPFRFAWTTRNVKQTEALWIQEGRSPASFWPRNKINDGYSLWSVYL